MFGSKSRVKAPYLVLDPEGEPRHFYEHTSLVLGEKAGREAYFRQLAETNDQARFEDLSPRDLNRARELRVELEVLMRIEGAGGAGFYITGNSPFEQRIIVANEVPVMDKATYDDEVAVSHELADLGRICRAVGFTIFYGARDLGEFKAKGWGMESIFNLSCNTQVQVSPDGTVISIKRDDDGQLDDVYGQIQAA